jgi:hypothetical protein
MEDLCKKGLNEQTTIVRKTSIQKTDEVTQRPQPDTSKVSDSDRPGKWTTKS